MNLSTVSEALKIILNTSENFGTEEVNFLDSVGRVLKEDIIADRDFPPFNRVSMDGIAIAFEAFSKGQRVFKIEGVQAAGSKQLTLQNSTNCVEAMTGAMLPMNTDVVIQYELLTIENKVATVNTDEIKKNKNVHLKGLDRKKGDVLIPKNTKISSAEVGVFATVGKTIVTVAKQPKVMIISTGNELVDVSENPAEHQIRRSNVFTLVSLLDKLKIKTETAHIPDDKNLLLSKIERFLNEYDVLLFSGAVSKGKFDYIPDVLDKLGVQKLFHRVQQRPGKPFWFGKKGFKTVFAFPGNPVSTFVSCLKYFYSWYYKSVGLNFENQNEAILNEDFYFKPNLTYFLQVKITQINGNIYATPVKGRGSADLVNLVDADAFLELPDNRSNFIKGEVFPLIMYR
ncbi:molybdopterin biosynthesis protein MoeA [Lutibacter profundi]|uniref:Molybdopterin molybdenumtransferase n=1 Tax=Lutibacter profundi TaxID=1622118 RepID=A0A0X8G806_9FLAO|nr:molybdopterin molybdotransferase MoeA [Lutibacter profundi]AMC11773.1 molybdopterin biosynthesis protein MoeA [Lutibacter profundi]